MTTVAWDGKLLAADTMGSWGGMRTVVHKIERCGLYIYAGCGNWFEIIRIQHWLHRIETPFADFELEEGGSSGLVIAEGSNLVYRVEGKRPTLIPVSDLKIADGGGRDFAIAAMAMGQSASEAIQFAMRFDIGTGGLVDIYDSETKEIRYGV
jgi:hypothetical protein